MFAPGYYEIDRIADGEEEENIAYMHVDQLDVNIYHLNFYGFGDGSPPLPALELGQSYRFRCVEDDDEWPDEDAKTARMSIDHWAMFNPSDCEESSGPPRKLEISPGPANIVHGDDLIGLGITMGHSSSTFGAWGVRSDKAWPIAIQPGEFVKIVHAPRGGVKDLYCACDSHFKGEWTARMVFENYD